MEPLYPHTERGERASGQCLRGRHCTWCTGILCRVFLRDKHAGLRSCPTLWRESAVWLLARSLHPLFLVPVVESGWQTSLAVHTPKWWRDEQNTSRTSFLFGGVSLLLSARAHPVQVTASGAELGAGVRGGGEQETGCVCVFREAFFPSQGYPQVHAI